jgi:hypothetical protein
MSSFLREIARIAVIVGIGQSALAIDGGAAPPPPPGTEPETSYYEQASASATVSLAPEASLTMDASASGGLPSSLYAIDGAGSVTYHSLGQGAWRVDIAMAERPHEKMDAVYDLVLAVPLPVGSSARDWRIVPREGTSLWSKPIVYDGEKVVLKRNVPLENAWLPLLVGASSGLPDLSRSGYVWTLWDAIVRYDATLGATLEAYGTFRYSVDPRVGAPDPANPDNAAYLITWVPTLESVPPFAVRLDVVGAAKE